MYIYVYTYVCMYVCMYIRSTIPKEQLFLIGREGPDCTEMRRKRGIMGTMYTCLSPLGGDLLKLFGYVHLLELCSFRQVMIFVVVTCCVWLMRNVHWGTGALGHWGTEQQNVTVSVLHSSSRTSEIWFVSYHLESLYFFFFWLDQTFSSIVSIVLLLENYGVHAVQALSEYTRMEYYDSVRYGVVGNRIKQSEIYCMYSTDVYDSPKRKFISGFSRELSELCIYDFFHVLEMRCSYWIMAR